MLPLPPSDRYRWGSAQTAFATILAVGAILALSVDLPLAQWLRRDPSPLPKDLFRVAVWGEAFAHAIGVALFVLAVYVLDPVGRFAVFRLLTASWGSGLVADLVKLSIRRFRPREFDYTGGVFDTFGPLWNLGNGTGRESFPSAHAATAVGLAVAAGLALSTRSAAICRTCHTRLPAAAGVELPFSERCAQRRRDRLPVWPRLRGQRLAQPKVRHLGSILAAVVGNSGNRAGSPTLSHDCPHPAAASGSTRAVAAIARQVELPQRADRPSG